MSKPLVAIFGLNGALGATTIAAFQNPTFSNNFQLPILAITRDPSNKVSTDVVKYVQGDIQDGKANLIKELANVDVAISLLPHTPEVLGSIEQILESVKPSVYIPSQFGTDISASDTIFPGLAASKSNHSKKVRTFGIKVVDIYTSFFVGGIWMYQVIGHIGADVKSKTVTYLGSPDSKFSYTSIDDIGRVVASVSSKAFSAPKDFPDSVKVQSGFLTPAEVVHRYESTNNVKFEVKEIVPREQVFEEAKAIWAKGYDRTKFLYYINALLSQGVGAGVLFGENDDEIVNPGESLWKWVKF